MRRSCSSARARCARAPGASPSTHAASARKRSRKWSSRWGRRGRVEQLAAEPHGLVSRAGLQNRPTRSRVHRPPTNPLPPPRRLDSVGSTWPRRRRAVALGGQRVPECDQRSGLRDGRPGLAGVLHGRRRERQAAPSPDTSRSAGTRSRSPRAGRRRRRSPRVAEKPAVPSRGSPMKTRGTIRRRTAGRATRRRVPRGRRALRARCRARRASRPTSDRIVCRSSCAYERLFGRGR